ncbi:PepSY-associated TM helix domain-containing protein [Corynebacterium hesseae]|uniref:PepSY-associated TM helix domain-containing protein n=1 Tax=Corynebacterium hesseae TaxID=2913502 RepID=UPI0022B9F861|nr:PepSY domain-containing protein [Corynebacterium hesseae]MCZ9298139.1 PepSY domain-containing protein [Corynebacterium hesseae]
MSRTALRSFIQRIHFYGGMFVGPFILIAALTGCLYAMAPTLEKVVYHDVLTVPTVENPLSLEEQIQAAQHEHPDMPVTQVWPATTPTDSTRVLVSDESIDESLQRTVFINPATAEVIGDYPTYSGLGEMPLRRWISSLHESFHLGKVGELYSELAASWLWVMACGGLYMWWIRRRPKNKATTKAAQQPKRSARWKATRLHSTIGAWIFIGLLGLSATGITWSGLAGGNVDSLVERMHWKATPINTALHGTTVETHEHTGHEGHEGHGASASTSVAADAERVLATGRAEGLTGPLRLYPPEDAHSAWQVSERWVEWRTTSDAISVDGTTGEVIDRQPFSSLPLFSKLSSWGIYLHMGIMFGLPLQIALLALGLATAALVVLGYYMWWKRRPRFLPTAHFSWATTGLGALFAATVGVFLPLLGITLAAFLVLDVILIHTPRQKKLVNAIT